MKAITFVKKVPGYNAGETAGFPDTVSNRYIQDGLAVPFTRDVPTSPMNRMVDTETKTPARPPRRSSRVSKEK